MSYPRFKSRQGGAALIVALLVFALASALMVGLQRDFSLQLQRGANGLVQEQSWSYLRGAEGLAAAALRLDSEQDKAKDAPRDDLSEVWASEARPYPLPEGGWLLGELEDLQGRLNLNNLLDEPNQSANAGSADPDPETDSTETDSQSQTNDPNTENVSEGAGSDEERRFTSGQKQLIRLLQTLEGLGVDQTQAIALTEAISDYMDADDQRRLAGAEDEAYRNGVPPYRPANQPIASVSELRAIVGITPEIYAALAPLVTVWPLEGSKLNILTAKPAVLRTINSDDRLEPLSLGDAQRLVELRERGEINEVEDLLTDIAFSDTAMNDIANVLGITSDWFLLSASVQIADREQRLYSVLQRNERRVVSRYRSLGEL